MRLQLLAFSFLLMATSNKSSGQDYSKADFRAITISDTSISQFRFLAHYIKDKKVVDLGEASHGTQEFYTAKALISKYLITHERFTTIAFEMDEKIAEKINSYVSGGNENITDILKQYGLYNASELLALIEWLKAYNQRQIGNTVSIIGFDSEDYWADPLSRDSLMAENLIQKLGVDKTIIWAHNSHLIKSDTWDVTNSGIRSMGNYIADYCKNDYYLLALDTYFGSLNTIENGRITAYEFKLEKAMLNDISNFFIDFNGKKALKYNLTHLSSNNEGDPQDFRILLGVDIDALLFIKNTSASKVLK